MTVLYALANGGVVLRLSDEVRAAPGVARPTSAFSPFVALPCPFASPSPPLARCAAGAAWRAMHRSCDRHPHRRWPSVLVTSEARAALAHRAGALLTSPSFVVVLTQAAHCYSYAAGGARAATLLPPPGLTPASTRSSVVEGCSVCECLVPLHPPVKSKSYASTSDLLRPVLKVTTHQDHIKTSRKVSKTIPRLNFSRRNHSPHPFGPQRSAWWLTVKVSDSSTSHASPTLVEPGTLTVHH